MGQQSKSVLQFELIQLLNIMKPRRPDSAKSHVTKITQDSDFSKKDLNISKFSETFSSGVNSTHEKGDQFKHYVEEKNKDPRFKHLKSKLEVIQEKTSQPQPSKPSFKPFQKKKDKTIEKNSNKKIEQQAQKPEKEEEQLTLSRGFAEKNKQKMNSLKQTTTQKAQEEKVKQTIKSKIKFDAFKINKPGEKRELKKAAEAEQKKQQVAVKQNQKQEVKPQVKPAQKRKNEKTEQQLKRQKWNREVQRHVNDVEARNIMNFPSNYDRFVNQASVENAQDLTKINLNDFMNDPTEEDLQQVRAKVKKFDTQLDSQRVEESIDLQSLIESQDKQKEDQQENQLIYASMSASEIKKRNAFITEVLSGKLSKNEIDRLEEMQKTSMKMYKLEHQKEHQNEEDDVEFSQINMVKRQTNRLMERNRLEAAGQLYRDCDYLSEQHQRRIEELLNGDIGDSPFECDQLQGMRRKRIDQGIRMYRQLSGANDNNAEILNEESLPKDPQLRKEAEKKVLKEKITNVNHRLAEVNKIVATKAKIEMLLKNFEHTRTSSNYQQIYQQNQQKFEEEMKMLAEAEDMVKDLSNKENIDEVVNEIQTKYRELQAQIRRFTQMDEKELMRLEKQKLKGQMREIEKIQRQSQQYEHEIDDIQRIKREIQDQLKIFDEIQELHAPKIQCQGYKQSETLEDIDAIITKKWQAQLNTSNQLQELQ